MSIPSYASFFNWKGVSSITKNIMVNKLPEIERPAANISKMTIPGRDGFLTIDDGTYQGIIKACECSLDDGNIDDVSYWLTGTDNVIFSNEPDRKYKATIINRIPFNKIIPTFHKFIVLFDCQPHGCLISNELITKTTTPSTISNSGYPSKPIIKVFGSGNIDLSINSSVIHLTNVADHVTINSELQDAYKDTMLKNSDMNGEFPILINGINNISWIGTVTKIEIIPNFRYLS